MILKTRLVLKDVTTREIVFEADMVVDDEEQARDAGDQFYRFALAISEGMDNAIERG